MNKPKPETISKHILLNADLDQKLDKLAEASYANASAVVRQLVDKEYKKYQEQLHSVSSIGVR